MKRLHLAIVLCVGFLSALAGGCTSANLQKPTATVTGMNVKGMDERGFTMNFDVDVANPNSVAIPLRTADYKLSIAGTPIADGKAKPEGSIPAGGRRSVSVPVTLKYEDFVTAKDAIVASGGNVGFALDGGLTLGAGLPLVGSMRVPMQYAGTLPFKEIVSNPRALLSNPAAQQLAKALMTSMFRN